MFIDKLEIKGFGKIENANIEFENGINIVYGENESGKSTLQMFIKAVLFGIRNKRGFAADSNLTKKHKPWNGESYRGSIEYVLENGKRFRIERDFMTNKVSIYDWLYNDITDQFERNKYKMPIIAETHFGVTDTCFERTVYVKQAEIRINEAGKKELISKMSNIYSSGFSDISYDKAINTLREFLKNNVGTVKTTKRPIDILQVNINKMEKEKQNLMEIRKNAMDVEDEINELNVIKNHSEEKLKLLRNMHDILDVKLLIEECQKSIADLDEIFTSILFYEDEKETIIKKIEEFEQKKKKYERFSLYDTEDLELLTSKYYEYCNLGEQLKSISRNIEDKNNMVEEILEDSIYKIFEQNNDQIEYVHSMEAELNSLSSSEINSMKSNEKVNYFSKLEKFLNAVLIVSIMVTGVSIIFEKVLNMQLSATLGKLYIVSGIYFILFFMFTILKYKKGTIIYELRNKGMYEKECEKDLQIRVNTLNSRLNKAYKKFGTENQYEFVKNSNAYGEMKIKLQLSEENLVSMDNEYALKSREFSLLKNEIKSVLNLKDTGENSQLQISEQYIKDFKYGVTKYMGVSPSIKYLEQRVEDLKENINAQLKQASLIVNEQVGDKNTLSGFIEQLAEKMDVKNMEYKHKTESLDQKNIDKFGVQNEYQSIIEENSNTEQIINWCDMETKNLSDEIVNIKLKINENMGVMKSIDYDNDRLQKLEEKITLSNEKKKELENKGKALRLAIEFLNEASEEIKVNFVPELNKKVNFYISRITSNKYKDIKLDDEFDMKLIEPVHLRVISSDFLSGGTLDQMYLALRMSMSEVIASNNEKLPFIMDEAFSQYDEKRLKETYKILGDMAENKQIILFTCKNREIELMKETGRHYNLIEIS